MGFPDGNVDGVATVEYVASGRDLNGLSHQLKSRLKGAENMPGGSVARMRGRLSAQRHMNLTVLGLLPNCESSEVRSVMSIGYSASKSVS